MKKLKNSGERYSNSVVAQTAGMLRTDHPTLTAEEERDLAIEAMAKEENDPMASSQLPNPLLHRR